MSKNILERLPQQSFSTPDIPKILKSLEDSLSFPSWHVRVKTLPVYAVYIIYFNLISILIFFFFFFFLVIYITFCFHVQ